MKSELTKKEADSGRSRGSVDARGEKPDAARAVSDALPVFLSQPGDVFEEEAEHVADTVAGTVGRDETVDAQEAAPAGLRHASIDARLGGGGAPLSDKVREQVESELGLDLAGVRVHQGNSAESLAARAGARAFTHQNHIWLGRGQRPNDVRLIAHEATHVAQQGTSLGPAPPLARTAPTVPVIQRQPDPAVAEPATEGTSAGRDRPGSSQQFRFSEGEMEARLGGAPATGASSQPDVQVLSKTTAVPSAEAPAGGAGAGEGEAEAIAEAGGETEGGPGEEVVRREPGGGEPAGVGAAEAAAPSSPEVAFEAAVDERVRAYLDGNLSPEVLATLTPQTQGLLDGAAALSERPVAEPEEGFLSSVTGVGALGRALDFSKAPRGYEGEEGWIPVVARIRDICSSLGGVVGMIGLVATVSGAILSLLIPPVGAFLLTVGRFCDIAALILDAISLVLSIILTSYNLYRLKNATNPEEKRRLLGLVRQEAVNTLVSGVAVATAIAPGVSKALGRTRAGQAVGRAAGRAFAPIGRGLGRGAAAIGRTRPAAFVRGIAARGGAAAKSALVRARGTRAIVAANRWASNLERRAIAGFERAGQGRLARRLAQTRAGAFYSRNVRGFYQRNRNLANMINDPIERQFQEQQGRALTNRLQQLQGQPNPAAVAATLEQEFGIVHQHEAGVGARRRVEGDFAVVGTPGNYTFKRFDETMLQRMREREFLEIQRLRANYPGADARVLAERINDSPFIRGRWNEAEVRAFATMNPNVRAPSGELVPGAVAKTPHHTIPAQVAPHIHREPRFIQLANAPSVSSPDYRRFIDEAYPPPGAGGGRPEFQRLPDDPASLSVPGARPGRPRQAKNYQEMMQGLADRGDFAVGTDVPDRNFFGSPGFIRELQEQGGSGAWINPRNPNQRFMFDAHRVIGHGWDTNDDTVVRAIFDEFGRQGLHGELARRLLLSEAGRRYLTTNPASSAVLERLFPGASTSPGVPRPGTATVATSPSTADARLIEQTLARAAEVSDAELPAGGGPRREAPAEAAAARGPGEVPPDAFAAVARDAPGTLAARSAPFLATLSVRMSRRAVPIGSMTLARVAAPGATEVREPTPGEAAPEERLPQPPPAPVLYSPAALDEIRAERVAVAAAIEMVAAFVQAANDTARDNQQAATAARDLQDQSSGQQKAVSGERADVSAQQGDLEQSQSAQTEMASQEQQASNKGQEGQNEGDRVQSDGSSVSVEAKPEDPSSRSWLEQAWDATAGALWENLVRPAIQAVRRKVNQVMQKINEFIMDMINSALGLDEIEAELDAGGGDIQQRQTTLQETDAGLTDVDAQAQEAQETGDATVDQAQQNIAEATVAGSDAEALLEALVMHHDVLLQEEQAAAAYIAAFGSQYAEYFAREGAQEAAPPAAPPMEEPAEGASAEETITSADVDPLVLRIAALQEAEGLAHEEVVISVRGCLDLSTPELEMPRRQATGAVVAGFDQGHGDRIARLRRLVVEAQMLVGLPSAVGIEQLAVVTDEVGAIAGELEAERIAALRGLYDAEVEAQSVMGAAAAT